VRVWSPTLSFCPCYGALPALPSFPTRRSSDLAAPSGPPSVRRADRPVWWRATVRALAGRTLAAGRRYPGTELCPWPGRLRLVARLDVGGTLAFHPASARSHPMNDLTRLLGCRLPILQAPMAGSQDHRLAAAVCQAGGLGALPAALLAPEALDAELTALRALTDQPFNVNFFAHTPPAPDAAKEQHWRGLLAPFYAEFGVDPASIPGGPGRQPFSAAMAEVIERHRPAVVSFHFGLPAPELLERVRATGARILSSATTVEEGLWLQERGVDA